MAACPRGWSAPSQQLLWGTWGIVHSPRWFLFGAFRFFILWEPILNSQPELCFRLTSRYRSEDRTQIDGHSSGSEEYRLMKFAVDWQVYKSLLFADMTNPFSNTNDLITRHTAHSSKDHPILFNNLLVTSFAEEDPVRRALLIRDIGIFSES